MKNVYVLLLGLSYALGLQAAPMLSARSYYEKGMHYFLIGDYKAAEFQFEYASFHDGDGSVSSDSVRIMRNLATYCKIHKDSGYVCYDGRRYDEAYVHYSLVSQKNGSDTDCREMMSICYDKCKMMSDSYSGMVRMEPGYFMMGRNDGPDNEKPSHAVRLDSFYIDKCEVSNAQYALFLNQKGVYDSENHIRICIDSPMCHIRYDAVANWYSAEAGYEDFPVLGVTWYGANDYAQWKGKSLPTEAQWEYAFGDSPQDGDGGYYHNVKSGKPNSYGIYGMTDNGREWVSDSYSGVAYQCSDTRNPEHHEVREYKTVRGGASLDDDFNPKTFRDYERPGFGRGSIGFRCVKNIASVK
ncbi:MAG: SUMF1/EgtB/PvdO family nonheme iron enzyme [Bacteroidales bacterium]|nr:SUMF1/EgtB/PvdO family nonheme iron enzyme [Bacteroidales bacterium]